MYQDLGCTTSIEVVNGLLALDGLVVIDVGCGDMTFTRQLADSGARALGVDPDSRQAAHNDAADLPANVAFAEAGATALPVSDGTVDGVFFSFSLHHVPASAYPQVFAEVRRVLKPTGILCVIEPADCPLNQVMKLFHDEDRVRADAQDALVRLAIPAFEHHAVFRYDSYIEYDSFDDFATQCVGRTFNSSYTEADVRRSEVAAAFERHGASDYRFASPKQMMFLRGVRRP